MAFRTSFTARCSYFLAEVILKYSFICSLGSTLHHCNFVLGTYLSKTGNVCYLIQVSKQICYVYLFQLVNGISRVRDYMLLHAKRKFLSASVSLKMTGETIHPDSSRDIFKSIFSHNTLFYCENILHTVLDFK